MIFKIPSSFSIQHWFAEWRWWFAWRPVLLGEPKHASFDANVYVWLRPVQRRLTWFGPNFWWEYRLPPVASGRSSGDKRE